MRQVILHLGATVDGYTTGLVQGYNVSWRMGAPCSEWIAVVSQHNSRSLYRTIFSAVTSLISTSVFRNRFLIFIFDLSSTPPSSAALSLGLFRTSFLFLKSNFECFLLDFSTLALEPAEFLCLWFGEVSSLNRGLALLHTAWWWTHLLLRRRGAE